MSVIIRLQNLPWSANALDIRQYFQGLSIPEGGVHIVGGEQGDAFIAFSTDEDARQAMMTDGGKIKEVKVKLMLSSRTEMQKVIEQARQQSVSLQTLLQMPAPPIIAPAPAPAPVAIPVAPVVTAPPVVTPVVPVIPATEVVAKQPERRDSKEKRDRRDRSRSRDRGRRDRDRRRRDRSRSRDRRRRRSRDRSRDRSKDRDKSKDRDRNKDLERRRISRDSHGHRTSVNKEERGIKEQNGSEHKPSGAHSSSVWEIPPSAIAMPAKAMPPFIKTPIIAAPPTRPLGPSLPDRVQPEVPLSRGDMDGRRIMGSGPFTAPGSRPMGTEATTSPFQPSNWQPIGRFPFQQQSFNEGNDFDFRASNFRGSGFRGRGDGRAPFNPRMGMMPGPGNILKPPGSMGPNSFPRMDNAFAPQSRFEPFPNRSFRPNYDPRATLAGSCVEIRNMPLDVGYSELRKFFQGLYVSNNAIKMINDNKGYRIGMAYMRFANPEAKDRAINHTGKTIRGSVIEVLHVDDEIFDKAVDNFRPDKDIIHEQKNELDQEDTSCLFIQDLPPYAKESDIYKLFPDMTVADVVLMNKDKQYVAYVKFLRPEEAKKALYVSLKPTIGHKAVALSLCAKQLFLQAKQVMEAGKKPTSVNGSPAKEPPSNSEDVSIIEIRSKSDPVPAPESRSQVPAGDAQGRPEELSDTRRRPIDGNTDPRSRPSEVVEPRESVMEVVEKPIQPSESGDPRTRAMDISDPRIGSIDHRNRSADIQDHRSRPMEALDHRGRPMEISDHRSRPMEMPDHRSRSMEMPDHRVRSMEIPDHRGRPMDITEHRGRPMDIPDHRGRPMDMLDHRALDHRARSMDGPIPEPRIRPVDHGGILDHREGLDHRGLHPDCVLLKGLPFQAKDRDILDFFSDVGLVPMRIHMMLDSYQKPTGDAYCEFQTPEEAMRASGKNNTLLGKHEVVVQPVSRVEMHEVLGFAIPDMDMGPPLRSHFPPVGRFPPNRTLLGNPRMPLMGGRGPMGHLMGLPKDSAPVEGFGKPGCVLALENIPFRVEVEEILEYFRGFDVTRENIIRRFNDQGMATGDARVSFATPAEAQRAARELRGGKIRNRPIFVNLV